MTADPAWHQLTDDIVLARNLRLPLPDGVRLAADVYLPAGEARQGQDRFPAVVDYLPYRKDDFDPLQNEVYLYLARHGYAAVRVDIRGTGASEGVSTDEYTLQEQLDGAAAVEQLAGQLWCDGHVNLMGASYGGFTALQIAAHAPPHLTSVIPFYFTDDRYTDECHYRGGLMRMYYTVGGYANGMIVRNALPPSPDGLGEDWAAIWEQHLAGDEPYLLNWLRRPTDGPYWRNGSVRDVANRIRCPVFMVGGWQDGYPNPPLRLYQALQVPRKVLIGPWDHTLPDAAVPGPRIDYLHEIVRWLDYWCKGLNNGIMAEPPIMVYMQHAQPPLPDRLDTPGEWRAEMGWPPPSARDRTLFLAPGGALADAPAADGSDVYDYHPAVGVMGGLWSAGLRFGLPGDQRPDEAFSLSYTTPPLEEDIFILGRPRAVLHVSSSAAVMGFAANLCDVAPDGTSQLVAKGMLNGTRRASLTEPEPLTPGEVSVLQIEIDCTAWRFARGHRLRLNISSADWPNVWPTPEPGVNRVHHGPARPSCLVLPVVPAAGSAPPPSFLPSSARPARDPRSAAPPTWQISYDLLTGRATSTILTSGEWRAGDQAVVRRESSIVCQVDPRDPAHASAQGRTVYRIVRPSQILEGASETVIQATAAHFHVTINLDLRLDGRPHFSRRWAESIPRHLL